MTPAMLDLLSGFRDRMLQLGQPFLHQRSGSAFRGILIQINPIDPQFELGSDWREMSTLECQRGRTPTIEKDDLVEQTNPFWRTTQTQADFPNPVWKVIRRDDNPASFAVKYWLVKVITEDAG